MAGASDKARFYLEQYVPELQEYAQKEIFTRDEISAIAAKRSDFEHILNARGSTPSDYARYVTYEINLDNLRKKRCKRLSIKSTTHTGQRTIFFILERATKKFPGDTGLWLQYIDFCKKTKANKKLAKAFTHLLRLKPREHGLWILAAKHYAEVQGDMSTARSYFQRGLRFCADKKELWLEYARLEMVYLAKLAARRKILGLDETRTEKVGDEGEDMIALPTITMAEIDPDANTGIEEVNVQALQRLATAPAFTGALPIAIFDAAMKEFSNDTEIAEAFFLLVLGFEQVPAAKTITQHILAHVQRTAPDSAEAIICECRMNLYEVNITSPEFPIALSAALSRISKGFSQLSIPLRVSLAQKTITLLLPFIDAHEDLEEDIVTVLEASINRYLRQHDTATEPSSNSQVFQALVNHYNSQGKLKCSDVVSIAGQYNMGSTTFCKKQAGQDRLGDNLVS